MAETPEKMRSSEEPSIPKNPEKKDIIPPVPTDGVPINETPENAAKQSKDMILTWKVLHGIYGKQKAEEFKDGLLPDLIKEIEKNIHDNPEYAQKIQAMIQKPEKYVSKEDIPDFKEFLQARVEAAKQPMDSPAHNKEDENLLDKSDEKKKEVSQQKSEAILNLEKQMAKAKNMSNSELMEAIFSTLGDLVKTLGQSGLDKMFGGGGPKFTPKQIEEVKVDITAAEKKEYDPKSENKTVEFLCNALNLPIKNSVMKLLYSLKSSPGVVYEKDKNKLSEGKIGDVIFFRKEGEDQPYLAALVSDIGPPMMMKYMDDKGEIKQEEVLTSPLYEQEWFGIVKFPEKQKPNETPQL